MPGEPKPKQTIAILQCGHVSPELKTQHGDYDSMYTELLQSQSADLALSVFDVTAGQFPSDLQQYNAYLISGSSYSTYEPLEWIQQMEAIIVELSKLKIKLIGICFGHQLIAQALGGSVEKSDKGWGIGCQTVSVSERKPWMKPFQDFFAVNVSHQDQVTALPPAAKKLACNEHCENSMFAIGNHVLCMQGHPEFSHSYNKALIESRSDILPENTLQSGLQSLEEKPHNNALIAQWILEFIR